MKASTVCRLPLFQEQLKDYLNGYIANAFARGLKNV